MSISSAKRRYNRDALILAFAYVFFLFAAILTFRKIQPTGLLAVAIAILPALPIIGMFVAIGRYVVEEHDEYLRLMLLRQILVASGFALSVATIWGFLESFDVAPHIDAYYLAVVWFGGLGIGDWFNSGLERRA